MLVHLSVIADKPYNFADFIDFNHIFFSSIITVWSWKWLNTFMEKIMPTPSIVEWLEVVWEAHVFFFEKTIYFLAEADAFWNQ